METDQSKPKCAKQILNFNKHDNIGGLWGRDEVGSLKMQVLGPQKNTKKGKSSFEKQFWRVKNFSTAILQNAQAGPKNRFWPYICVDLIETVPKHPHMLWFWVYLIFIFDSESFWFCHFCRKVQKSWQHFDTKVQKLHPSRSHFINCDPRLVHKSSPNPSKHCSKFLKHHIRWCYHHLSPVGCAIEAFYEFALENVLFVFVYRRKTGETFLTSSQRIEHSTNQIVWARR